MEQRFRREMTFVHSSMRHIRVERAEQQKAQSGQQWSTMEHDFTTCVVVFICCVDDVYYTNYSVAVMTLRLAHESIIYQELIFTRSAHFTLD